MLPFSQPSCYSKTKPPFCALGTSFYTVSEGSDLMTYVSDNYTSCSAPSRLRHKLTNDGTLFSHCTLKHNDLAKKEINQLHEQTDK